jgi:hypothetical protein
MEKCPSNIGTQQPDNSGTRSRQPLIPDTAEVVSCATSRSVLIRVNPWPRLLIHGSVRGLCHTSLAHPQIDLLSFASSRLGDFALKTSPRHAASDTPHHLSFRLIPADGGCVMHNLKIRAHQCQFVALDFEFLLLSGVFPSLSPQPLPLGPPESMCERPQLTFTQGLGDLGYKSVTRPGELCHAVQSRVTLSEGGLCHTGIAHQQINLLSFAPWRLCVENLSTPTLPPTQPHHISFRLFPADGGCVMRDLKIRVHQCQSVAPPSHSWFCLALFRRFAISPRPSAALPALTSPPPRVRLVLSHGTLRSPV